MQISDIMSAYQSTALNNETALTKKDSQTESENGTAVYSWKSDVVSISAAAMQKAQSATAEDGESGGSLSGDAGDEESGAGGVGGSGGGGGSGDDKEARIQELTAKLQQLQSKLGRVRSGQEDGGEVASIMAEIGAVAQELAALQSEA